MQIVKKDDPNVSIFELDTKAKKKLKERADGAITLKKVLKSLHKGRYAKNRGRTKEILFWKFVKHVNRAFNFILDNFSKTSKRYTSAMHVSF